MNRREEVEQNIKWVMSAGISGGPTKSGLIDLARTLADEVDAERAIITKLLALLEPGECKDWLGGYWLQKHTLYNRALEIAGRKE